MIEISAESFTTTLSTLVLVTHVVLIVFILGNLFVKKKVRFIREHFGRNGLTYALLISLSAMLGSLYYSDVQGLEPCTLCWYQRIFMYPMVFLLSMAIFRKDGKASIPYIAALNFIGGAIALYHTYLQSGFADKEGDVTCSIYSEVSCTSTYFVEYGYITIPVISLTAFVMIGILLKLKKKHG